MIAITMTAMADTTGTIRFTFVMMYIMVSSILPLLPLPSSSSPPLGISRAGARVPAKSSRNVEQDDPEIKT